MNKKGAYTSSAADDPPPSALDHSAVESYNGVRTLASDLGVCAACGLLQSRHRPADSAPQRADDSGDLGSKND